MSGAAARSTFRVRASSIARWIVVLPASFGPWTIVSPGDERDLELAVAPEVAER